MIHTYLKLPYLTYFIASLKLKAYQSFKRPGLSLFFPLNSISNKPLYLINFIQYLTLTFTLPSVQY